MCKANSVILRQIEQKCALTNFAQEGQVKIQGKHLFRKINPKVTTMSQIPHSPSFRSSHRSLDFRIKLCKKCFHSVFISRVPLLQGFVFSCLVLPVTTLSRRQSLCSYAGSKDPYQIHLVFTHQHKRNKGYPKSVQPQSAQLQAVKGRKSTASQAKHTDDLWTQHI